MKLERSFWLFLLVGTVLRCIAINQPLVDAHPLRQCITAAATESLIDQPGFNLSYRIPWSGDLPQAAAPGLLGIVNRFRPFNRAPEPTDWFENSGFRIFVRQNDFLVYSRDH
jgi:hypothetical protein